MPKVKVKRNVRMTADADAARQALEVQRIEYVSLSLLQRWPTNAKKHDDTGIATSVERFGFVQPLIVDETTGKLVAGHGRLDVLTAMKVSGKAPPRRVRVEGNEWLVPVLRGTHFANEDEAGAYVLADNRLVEAGGWDEDLLGSVVADYRSREVSLDNLGFSSKELDELAQIGSGEPFEERVETPDGDRQKNTDEKKDTFLAAAFRQVILVYAAQDYTEVIRLLDVCKTSLKVETNAEAVTALLRKHAASRR